MRSLTFWTLPSRTELTFNSRPAATGSCSKPPYFRTEFSEGTIISRLLLSFVIRVSAMPSSSAWSRFSGPKGFKREHGHSLFHAWRCERRSIYSGSVCRYLRRAMRKEPKTDTERDRRQECCPD